LPSQTTTSSQCSEPPSKRSRQLTLFGSKKNIGLTEIETNEINKSLIKMIVFDYQPLSIVENVPNLPILKVKQDVVTRWNSSLIMIERLIDIKNPLSATMSSLPRAPNYLNACEWEIILDCIHILKPLEIMTAELSGENYVTISSIIPLIRDLQHIIKSVQIKTSIGEAFKNTLIDVVNRRLGHLEKNMIVAKATFLDPRFKKNAFGLLENANNVQKLISDELTPMIICANNDINNSEVNKIQSTITASTSDTSNSIWDHFDSKVSQVQSSSSPSTTSTLIIRQYLEMPLLDRKKIHYISGSSIKIPFQSYIKCN